MFSFPFSFDDEIALLKIKWTESNNLLLWKTLRDAEKANKWNIAKISFFFLRWTEGHTLML